MSFAIPVNLTSLLRPASHAPHFGPTGIDDLSGRRHAGRKELGFPRVGEFLLIIETVSFPGKSLSRIT